VGAATLAGQAPAVRQQILITPPAGQLTAAGVAVRFDLALRPGAGSLAVAGVAPTAPLAIFRTPPAGGLVVTGVAPASVTSRLLTPPAGAITLAGQAARLDLLLRPLPGTLRLVGRPPGEEAVPAGRLIFIYDTRLRDFVLVPRRRSWPLTVRAHAYALMRSDS
jgi:hypothetical protein